MAPLVPAILQTPWPPHPSRTILTRDEEPALREVVKGEYRRALEEYRSQTSALREEKLTACPRLAIRLSDASTLSLSEGTLEFTATLFYRGSPESTPSQPIVLHLFGHKAAGPLSEKAVYWGQYQIFNSPKKLDEHRLPFVFHNMSLRPPRDASGRFIKLSDDQFTYVISEAEGWIELFPGQEVSRRVTLRLDQSAAWQREVRAGRDFWLRWVPSGTVGNPKKLWGWKYGGLKDYEGVIFDKRKDEFFWIAVPVKAEDSGLKFKVVDGVK